MSFRDFYNMRMQELVCESGAQAGQNPFKSTNTIPSSVESPYFRDRDIWRHYPNMYDFRKAASFNTPSAVLYPYNDPLRQPGKMPEYMQQQDFRKKSLLTKHSVKSLLAKSNDPVSILIPKSRRHSVHCKIGGHHPKNKKSLASSSGTVKESIGSQSQKCHTGQVYPRCNKS